MSRRSFLSFHYGNLTKSFSLKPTHSQKSFSSQKQRSSISKDFQPNMEEMKWVFNKFDSNKDGKITKEEYKLAKRALDKGALDNEMTKEFKAMDSNGDGFIDFKEFMALNNVGGGVAESEIQSAFRAFDIDGDGKISSEELMEILKRLGECRSIKACREMVKSVDGDGDGFINMDEFVSMMKTLNKIA